MSGLLSDQERQELARSFEERKALLERELAKDYESLRAVLGRASSAKENSRETRETRGNS